MKRQVLQLVTLAVCAMGSQSWAADTLQSEVPAILDGVQACTLSDSTMDNLRGEAWNTYTFAVKVAGTFYGSVPVSSYKAPWLDAYAKITISQMGKSSASKTVGGNIVKNSAGTYWTGMKAEADIQYYVADYSYVVVQVQSWAKILEQLATGRFYKYPLNYAGTKSVAAQAVPTYWGLVHTVTVPVSVNMYRY